jgi:hypothetical protein
MRVALLAIVAACGGKSDPCGDLDRRAVEHVLGPAKVEGRLAPKLVRALVESCTTNRWPAHAIECTGGACTDTLTPGQRAHAERLLAEVLRDDAAHPPERRLDPKDIIGSPLPDADVDPMYPTPKRAGTQNLFTLEDPERGPKAPVDFKLPPRSALTWTDHAYCDDDKVAPVCSPPGGRGLWRWRVGRDGKGLVVAEQLRGAAVHKMYVYTADATGSPLERIELDAYGRVQRALLFVEGNRYTGRERTGGNALDGCGFMKYALDANRRIAQLVCEQWLGGTMLDTRGVARTDFVRDERGFVIEDRKLGLDGKPVVDRDGVAGYAYELAPDGQRVVTRHRDRAGAPVRSTADCFARRTERDAQGTVARSICLDSADRPTPDGAGIAIVQYRNDAQGCRIGVRNLDANGDPATNHHGSHGEDLATDAKCTIRQRTCIDTDGTPLACAPGEPARSVWRLDAFGRVTSSKYYDAARRPAGDSEYHVFEIRTLYDELDRDTVETCWDATGHPAECDSTGFHRRKTTYDDAGRAVEEHYYDAAGEPVQNYQAWIRRYRYDNYDHLFEQTAHDAGGTAIEAGGVATRRDLFDGNHRLFGALLLDKAGHPARYTGCYTGVQCPWREWHAVRIVRRPDGSAEKNLFFDAQGKLLETQECTTAQCWDMR